MTETIRTKQELLGIFADSNANRIVKQDIRDFIVSNLVEEIQYESVIAAIDSLSDTVVALPGCTTLILPLTSSYGDRQLRIINISGADVVIGAEVGDTIDDGASVLLSDKQFLIVGKNASNWISLINTSADAPAEYALAIIQDSAAVTDISDGVYVDIDDDMTSEAASIQMLVGANEVTYVGTESKTFAYSISLAATKIGGSPEVYTFSLVLNGTPIAPKITANMANAVLAVVCLSGIVDLAADDEVKLQVRGDGTADDLVVADLHLRLTEIKV